MIGTVRSTVIQGVSDAPFGQGDLNELQSRSLRLMALLAGVLAYGPFLAWPLIHHVVDPYVWYAVITLAITSAFSLIALLRNLTASAIILVLGILAAIVCVVFATRSQAALHLFALPVIVACTVLSHKVGVLAVLVVGTAALAFSIRPVVSDLAADIIMPMVFIGLVTFVSWLSTQNLNRALVWVWHGYERARNNEQVARERQQELARTLKALDEATYRLERTNYALGLARDQAEEARRLKQRFAQSVSHELRTPLNLIVGFTELMTESPEYYSTKLSPHLMRDLLIVHRNASHLQGLVNDVLDLARIDSSQMSVLIEEMEAEALVASAMETVKSLIQSRGLTVCIEIEPDLPRLHVDPTRIRQVLINLIANAARFTDKGNITVTARGYENELVVSVRDTGVGIAAGDLARIFEEFGQVGPDTRDSDRGTGLGLAISRRFVEMHGGRIWAESTVGIGSVFSFSIPIHDHRLTSSSRSGDGSIMPSSSSHGEQPVLLVVSSSPTSANLLQRYVYGFRVAAVPDIAHGEQVAHSLLPQAILFDTGRSEITPVEAQKLVRGWGCTSTPILMCQLPDEKRLSSHPMLGGYLVKPVSRHALYDLLRAEGDDVQRILVVDDDLDFVELLARMLNDNPVRHYEVFCAYRGQEALDMLDLYHPDLVLLDLGLPDIDGYQVVRQMQTTERWSQTRLIIVSAQDQISDRHAVVTDLMATKTNGLMPSEAMRWIRAVLATSLIPAQDSEALVVQQLGHAP